MDSKLANSCIRTYSFRYDFSTLDTLDTLNVSTLLLSQHNPHSIIILEYTLGKKRDFMVTSKARYWAVMQHELHLMSNTDNSQVP